MWQQIAAVISAILLVTAPYWNGYATSLLIVLLNAAVAGHVLYLSLSSWAIARIENRTWQRHDGRRWLDLAAGLVAIPAVVLPPLLGMGANLVADRDNLVFGAAIFFFSIWAFLLPRPSRAATEEHAAEHAAARTAGQAT